MIKDCLDGKIDYIVTKSVSRFARNTVECLEYVRMLRNQGIGILFEEQNIDTLKTDSELYLVIYAGFAQSESESISKNVIWSVRKNFEDGKVTIPYSQMLGYKKGEDGTPEIIPEEGAIVERIYQMYLAGETPQSISLILRGEDIKLDKKLTFSKNMISSILSNIKYTGDAILQQTVTIDCISKIRKKNTGQAPMYYVHNSHPAIISREIYNKAQEEKVRRNVRTPQSAKNTITASGKYSKYALTDVLICGECGSRYKRCHWNIRGNKKIVWRCVNRLDYGKKYCKESLTLNEPELHSAVVRAINSFNENDTAAYMTLMRATIGEALGLGTDTEETELLQRRITALNQKMMRLVNESIASGTDIEASETEFKDIAEEISQLKGRITAIQESARDKENSRDRENKIQDIIDAHKNSQGKYDDSIVRQMIECIKTYPDGKLEVIFGGGFVVEESI